jgi:CRAL/TRIO, N-terminal domain
VLFPSLQRAEEAEEKDGHGDNDVNDAGGAKSTKKQKNTQLPKGEKDTRKQKEKTTPRTEQQQAELCTQEQKQREAVAEVRALVFAEAAELLQGTQHRDDSEVGSGEVDEHHSDVDAGLDGGPALRRWLTDACVRRYLVARDWDVAKATKMLVGTVQWRAAYRPWDTPRSIYHKEASPAKMYVSGVRDREGCPLIMMR